ncbi:MAG: hypothetical protein IPK58_02000 [Acidobacteria bacterium]|nr:hypothetical protein [Acidobacteriota bacterium]
MSIMKSLVSVYVIAVLAVLGLAGSALAQKAPNQREVAGTLRSLDSKVDDLRYSLRYGLRDSDDVDSLENDVVELDRLIRAFQTNLNQRRENADDVLDVLNAAKSISDYLRSNRVNDTVQKDWNDVRTLLDRLARNYSVNWDWNAGGNTTRTMPMSSNSLTGTYQLDASRSEDTRDIVENSDVSDAERQDLENKLEAAEQIAIEIRGNQVTLASTRASAVTFTADGRTRVENSSGTNVRVRALLGKQDLTISSLGGESDYTITFAIEDGGRGLKVTRRITTKYLSQTVFADSFYNKTDQVARLDIDTNPSTVTTTTTTDADQDNQTYSSNDPTDDPNAPTTRTQRTGDFIVPGGTIISGILENDLSTKISQNNDRFRMTVQSPNEYRGAVIEGYISGINRSGKVTGRSKLTFNFEKITLRSGETYDFAGYLQSVTDQNGKTVKIDTEGTAKGDSQTKETVKRGGIGAGAGALIGAILGGGKGAAIGAIIGGSAGAGSVVLQGKDDLELKQGSTVTVQSSSPNR